MSVNSTTSLIPSVAREFCLLLVVVLFAGLPFAVAQAEENPVAQWSAPV